MLLLLAVVAAGCAPPGVVKAAKPVLPEPLREEPYPRADMAVVSVEDGSCEVDSPAAAASGWMPDMDLKGDPGFSPSDLPPDVRCWYEVLWNTISDPVRAADFTDRASRADLYVYARELNNHLVALLTAFRLTGDLALLDEVDRLAQHMRATLEDTWKGRYRSSRGSVDGYLNWVWDRDYSDTHKGRDINELDEIRTHSGIAQLAYAFSQNADLESPNGVDYGERASFWLEYLTEHFEPKWRERNDIPWPKFPFLDRPFLHSTIEFVRYHHYMQLLTGEAVYGEEARRLSKLAYGAFKKVDTDQGTALVAPHGIGATDGGVLARLIPSIYFRHVIASAVDLYFEGVEPWSDDAVMAMLARSLSVFILDGEGEDFARDIGGGKNRAGIQASSRDYNRIRPSVYNVSPFALLAAWDDTGEVAETSLGVHQKVGKGAWNVFIPTGLLMDAALGGDHMDVAVDAEGED